MAQNTQSYRDLIVWQKSMSLVEKIYRLTAEFPSEEKFGLVSQMRRAAVSIPSNIAEGYRRSGQKDYIRFCRYSFGSGSELETQLEIAQRLEFVSEGQSKLTLSLLDEVMRMLTAFIRSLERSE
jgi:four helix bundle protein